MILLEDLLSEPDFGSAMASLDPEGRIVVQHLGFRVDDVDAWAGKLTAAGTAAWVRGAITLGPAKTQFE